MVYFLIPTYNDANNAQNLIHIIHTYSQKTSLSYRIYFLNDASIDNIEEIITEIKKTIPHVQLLNFSENRGPGAVVLDGIKHIQPLLKEDDILIIREADSGNNDLRTLKLMLHKMEMGYDIISASVCTEGGRIIGISFLRLLLTYACNMIYRILFHVKGIKDYTIFYRGYSHNAIQTMIHTFGDDLIESKGFAFSAELLIKARKLDLLFGAVPLILRLNLAQKTSSMNISKTIKEHANLIRKSLWIKLDKS